MSKGPKFIRFFVPVLKALVELGGSARPAEVRSIIIDRLTISDDEQSTLTKNGQPLFDNEVGWSRFYLARLGYLDSSKRGVWRLTEKGQKSDLEKLKSYTMFKEARELFLADKSKREIAIPDSEDKKQEIEDIDITDSPHRELLLKVLRDLPAQGFERLCQRLLRESGFQNVTVTGRSGDGGIDVHGILQLNPFVSFPVMFQCKRYSGSVVPSQVRDFRGAMTGRADKGIIITTGTYTSAAKAEAVRDGAPPIELVDWEKLLDMFEELELGLEPKTTYEVDQGFFEEFKDGNKN